MRQNLEMRRSIPSLVSRVAAVFAVILTVGCAGDGADAAAGDVWGTNSLTASQLVQELSGPDKPVVVCTAPPVMYRMGHIPGAVLYGPMTAPAAVSALTAWAKTLPKSSSVVIYCGCCPLAYCPNLRPAYLALKDMGFRRLRVLILPNDFGTDWVRLGYPVTR